MPVQRFRDPDAAREALEARPVGDLIGRIRRLWARSARLAPPWTSPGVHRFHSIEEANEDRDRAVAERARRLRERSSG